MNEVKLDIQPEDLSEEARQIVETIGLDALLALSRKFPGERIYIPEPARLAAAARNRAIRAEFNGRNYRELAVKYGLTTRWIRVLVGHADGDGAAEKDDDPYRQMKLF
jgi:Mor family transcriptional regulator